MKRLKTLALTFIVLSAVLVSCGSEPKEEQKTANNTVVTEPKEESKEQPKEEVKETKNVQTMGIQDFDNLIQSQDVVITETRYTVQDAQYKSLYPDLLQVILKNNTDKDIKDVIVAYVAWDENNLPSKIEGSMDFSGGSYVKEVNFGDINLVPGSTFGEDSGYGISETTKITSFKAIPISYVTFDGTTWTNPYYDEFKSLYEGKKYSDDLTVEVTIEENTASTTDSASQANANTNTSSASVDESTLNENLAKDFLVITEVRYTVQDAQYKSLYPDLLQVILKNNSDSDIKDAVVAFVAWDKNNLPVKIEGSMDFNGGSYVKQVNFSDINLISGGTFGEDSGYEIADGLNITTFKAIPISYTTFDGQTWSNPNYKDFKTLYEGKKLN